MTLAAVAIVLAAVFVLVELGAPTWLVVVFAAAAVLVGAALRR